MIAHALQGAARAHPGGRKQVRISAVTATTNAWATAVAYLALALPGLACGARTGLLSATESGDSGPQPDGRESGPECTPRCSSGQSVDSTSVYWADMSGYIKSVPK